MKGMPNMGNLMKQAQQFQAKMTQLQEEMGEKTVEASAGGGMVSVVANGRQEIISIKIETEVIDPDDAEMLQDLIMAAVNDALSQAKKMVNEEMGKLTHGLNLPNVPGLFERGHVYGNLPSSSRKTNRTIHQVARDRTEICRQSRLTYPKKRARIGRKSCKKPYRCKREDKDVFHLL